jgi:hypothetical protein
VWDWLNQVNATGFAGHDDWRVPTVKREGDPAELETVVDLSQGFCRGDDGACIAPTFGVTAAGRYWSATLDPILPLPGVARGAFFGKGFVLFFDHKAVGHFVRAVRQRL